MCQASFSMLTWKLVWDLLSFFFDGVLTEPSDFLIFIENLREEVLHIFTRKIHTSDWGDTIFHSYKISLQTLIGAIEAIEWPAGSTNLSLLNFYFTLDRLIGW